MKLSPAFRPIALSALLTLAPVGLALAQTEDPAATITPQKPAAMVATPSPSAAVNTSPATAAAEETPAAPKRPKLTPEERAARKKERIAKYDKNKDGRLDKSEKAAMRAEMGIAPKAKASPQP